jgi:hypothetical protein
MPNALPLQPLDTRKLEPTTTCPSAATTARAAWPTSLLHCRRPEENAPWIRHARVDRIPTAPSEPRGVPPRPPRCRRQRWPRSLPKKGSWARRSRSPLGRPKQNNTRALLLCILSVPY